MLGAARVRVPERAKRGEVIEIRAMIEHPMESGFRLNNVAKPKGFPMVDPAEHAKGDPCNTCHSPHHPEVG